MKKTTILICFHLMFLCIFGLEPENSKYEDYIVIKYLLNSREFEKAEALIDGCLKKSPDDPFVLTEKAYILKNIKKDYKKAVKLIEKSRETYPGYYYSNYLHASILFAEYHEKRKDKGLVDKAIEYLKVSLEDNKDFYNSYFLLGVILSEIGEYKESNKYFELSNRLKETPEAYFNIAANYNNLKDIEGEIRAYEKLLAYSPDNYNVLNILSRLHLKKSDFKSASIYFGKLFLIDPKDNNITFKYLYSLFAAGENEKFIEVSDKIDISNSSLLVYARAFILSTKGRFAEAEKLLNELKDKDLKSRILLADIYYRRQDYYKGYQILKKIDTKDRDNIYYSLLLEILSGLNMNRKTIDVFNIVKNNDSILNEFTLGDYYNIIFAFINLNEIQQAYQAALAFYNKLKKSPVELKELIYFLERFSGEEEIDVKKVEFEPNIFLILGLYRNLGKFDRAISLIERLVKKGSATPTAHQPLRGSSPEGERKNVRYLNQLFQNIDEKEENQAYFLELSEIYLQQKKHEEVDILLKWLLEKYPSSVLVKNYYAYYLALQNKELESALKLSAYTLEKDGENPAYLDTYGYILFKLGRTAESLKYLRKAYEKHPLEPEIMEHMADYYRNEKDFKRVIEVYKKAIDNGVDFKEELIKKIERLND